MFCNNFDFKGGVLNLQGGGTCKFMLFLLNGAKEVSLSNAIKFGFADHRPALTLDQWSKHAYHTSLNVVKVFLHEHAGFGKETLSQSFFLALGKRLEKQVVTIQPRLTAARASKFMFKAEATFLKKSKALALLEPGSLSANILERQQQPPVHVLKEIVTIERQGLPKELKINSHGGVRKLRIQ